jgi:hypothetical protein
MWHSKKCQFQYRFRTTELCDSLESFETKLNVDMSVYKNIHLLWHTVEIFIITILEYFIRVRSFHINQNPILFPVACRWVVILNLKSNSNPDICINVSFGSRTDGESFAKLSAAIVDKGPTVIIVWEQDGTILGGFASHSWFVFSTKSSFKQRAFTSLTSAVFKLFVTES